MTDVSLANCLLSNTVGYFICILFLNCLGDKTVFFTCWKRNSTKRLAEQKKNAVTKEQSKFGNVTVTKAINV